ncbi:MAG TPA: diguanylate cyclase response regulator [Chloroflexus aurantiacus]|mgnify:FL=1|uniref:Diguanylate cyclase n=1 Tax=Chloroflexus aurantiacus (strain ATCC 29366 / DSM 635 / J-10-fl) TaxID=324602 RepID=A9WAQ8_CHLAA|nr:response regulator [Chloroflexus aurantiacus]ABY33286.1 diguanylate cyclase [Chloroflexus aurantiacus J-10-fl]RMG51235.1 MAG: diguanylate cyclase [Chloroflexota bacterium]HBW66987.1 diguanylate cyclase response regulator [Chloroflexus aurantiacus]
MSEEVHLPTVLFADDDPHIRTLLSDTLTQAGFAVLAAEDGLSLIRIAQEQLPDIILVDLMLPGVDGYEAIRQLRNDTRTAHLPIIIVTARANPSDVVIGFDTGADDYITKPFNEAELVARIRSLLRRITKRPVRNPLTGLPGNVLIGEEIRYRLQRGEPFTLLYTDINEFKAFNDKYGFARGDQVIRLVAELCEQAQQFFAPHAIFVGHIGGDDFVLLCPSTVAADLARWLVDQFEQAALSLYDEEDRQRGYLVGYDRAGNLRHIPLATMAVGGVSSRLDATVDELSREAAAMKHAAKVFGTSAVIIDHVRLR